MISIIYVIKLIKFILFLIVTSKRGIFDSYGLFYRNTSLFENKGT